MNFDTIQWIWFDVSVKYFVLQMIFYMSIYMSGSAVGFHINIVNPKEDLSN